MFKTDNEQESPTETIRINNWDVGMEFGIEMLIIRNRNTKSRMHQNI